MFNFYNTIHVARNNLQDDFQCMENQKTPQKTLFYFILMNFHSSTPKTDCKNERTRSKLWENSCFDFYNTIHLARNNFQDDFQCMENQGNSMKDTVFYFDEFPLKHL